MIGLSLILFALLPVTNLEDGRARPVHSGMPYDFAAQAAVQNRPGDAVPSGDGTNAGSLAISYRLSGEKSLRPSRIGDDGVHMYLEWSEEQALPAVFAINALGEEEMVDGYMRQGIFTIDRVHHALVFRIGKKRARAERVNK